MQAERMRTNSNTSSAPESCNLQYTLLIAPPGRNYGVNLSRIYVIPGSTFSATHYGDEHGATFEGDDTMPIL